MGRKGSWFSAIKRVFAPSSKEKSTDGLEKKGTKEKKKSRGILRHGDTKSFIPMFREPSSIEKILGEVDEQNLFFKPPISSSEPQTPTFLQPRPPSPKIPSPKVTSPRASSSRPSPPPIISSSQPSPPPIISSSPPPIVGSSRSSLPGIATRRVSSPKVVSPKALSPRVTQQHKKEISYRPEPTSRNLQISATKIQAAYRGYIARRSYRALRGLVRLQGVIRGQNVKRQTMNAMKQMQLLVKVQTQIQSRRIQMLENQAAQRQAYKNDKDLESTLSKWTFNQMVDSQNEDWDDSVLTKDQREARMHKKVEAVIKRERARAYAYSHQLGKPSPGGESGQEVRTGGFPWWWNWLERQLGPGNPKNVDLTPSRPISGHKPSPSPRPYNYGYENHESLTPTSTKSSMPTRTRPFHTPSRTPPGAQASSSSLSRYSRARGNTPMKDDDSLTSCPPFSVPNYMQPTVSAKAKTRANSIPKERIFGTPENDSKRRFSFPLTPNIGSFKWNKGSSSKDSPSRKVIGKHQSRPSVGEVSIDSAVSMPATFGRRPFNRFV